MKAAPLFVKCLENEGVESIFGIPRGEHRWMATVLFESPAARRVLTHEVSGPVV
jgi:thiamine pyrophosphate-dependent acetolactate synthase large subunit-like protein